ncbi:cysteine-rich CWC family protein [Labilibacter sediminis]|nr:cysteine-rich CWC family protein [Labilibacter sediminis]
MIKKCAKCNAEFKCRHDEILECHCVQVPISDKAQRYLTQNFKDCLCNKCLWEVAKKFASEPSNKEAKQA